MAIACRYLPLKDCYPGRITQIVEFLQAREWSGVIITDGKTARAGRDGETLPMSGSPSEEALDT
jgi:hypothetical protein